MPALDCSAAWIGELDYAYRVQNSQYCDLIAARTILSNTLRS